MGEESTPFLTNSVYRKKHKEYGSNIKVQGYFFGFAHDLL